MREFRKDEKLAKRLISFGKLIRLHLLRSDYSIAEMFFKPIGDPITQYTITHNVYLVYLGYKPNSLDTANLSNMKKVPRLMTEALPVAGGIATEYLAIALASGYTVKNIEGRETYGIV